MNAPKKTAAKAAPAAEVAGIGILDLFRFAREIDLKTILNIPTMIANGEALRDWLRAVLGAGEVIAALTPVTFDDDAVKVLAAAVEDDETWSALHDLLMHQFNAEGRILAGATAEAVESEQAVINAKAKIVADKTEVDPATIILIIQSVLAVIKWWRERK